jgi:hypothetical protein
MKTDKMHGNTAATTAPTHRSPRWRGTERVGPHQYVVGGNSISRFLTLAEECTKAGLLW